MKAIEAMTDSEFEDYKSQFSVDKQSRLVDEREAKKLLQNNEEKLGEETEDDE